MEDRDIQFNGKNAITVREGIEFRDHGGNLKRLINRETVGSKRLTISISFLNPREEIIPNTHKDEVAFFSFKVKDLPLWRGLVKRRSREMWRYGYHRMPNVHSETQGMSR